MKRSITALLALSAASFSCCAAQAQISDDVVKIGVLTDMSSVYADGTGKGSLTAAQMAAEDFGGSVKGKKIEIIGADHQNKPDVGISIARTWYDTERVDAIADVPTSSIALAVSTLTREKNKVFLVSGGGTSDLASFLVQAQASKAKVIAFANAGGDASNAAKQANEFGIVAGGQKILALLMSVTDAHALGLQYGQGLILTEGFYWNKDEETR